MRGLLVAANVVLALLFAVRSATAQSCCTATGSEDFGVVGRCHFATIALQAGYDHGFGSFDARGEYRALDGAAVDDVVATLGAGIRLGTPLLQIHGAIPLRAQRRDLRGLDASTRFGPGDAMLALRATAIEDPISGIDLAEPGSWRPFFEPFVGVRAPTGRSPTDSDDPAQADVTGDGGWTLFGGAAITKFVAVRHALLLSGSYGYRFAHDVDSPSGPARHFEPGYELDAKLGYMHVVDLFWSWTVFASYRATANSSYDGVEVADSATGRARLGASVSHYFVYPTWQVSLSAALDPPADGFGKNVPFAGSSVAIGIQRHFTY